MKRIFHILILTILCSLAYGQDTLLYRIGRVDSVPLTSEIKTFDLSGGKVYYINGLSSFSDLFSFWNTGNLDGDSIQNEVIGKNISMADFPCYVIPSGPNNLRPSDMDADFPLTDTVSVFEYWLDIVMLSKPATNVDVIINGPRGNNTAGQSLRWNATVMSYRVANGTTNLSLDCQASDIGADGLARMYMKVDFVKDSVYFSVNGHEYKGKNIYKSLASTNYYLGYIESLGMKLVRFAKAKNGIMLHDFRFAQNQDFDVDIITGKILHKRTVGTYPSTQSLVNQLNGGYDIYYQKDDTIFRILKIAHKADGTCTPISFLGYKKISSVASGRYAPVISDYINFTGYPIMNTTSRTYWKSSIETDSKYVGNTGGKEYYFHSSWLNNDWIQTHIEDAYTNKVFIQDKSFIEGKDTVLYQTPNIVISDSSVNAATLTASQFTPMDSGRVWVSFPLNNSFAFGYDIYRNDTSETYEIQGNRRIIVKGNFVKMSLDNGKTYNSFDFSALEPITKLHSIKILSNGNVALFTYLNAYYSDDSCVTITASAFQDSVGNAYVKHTPVSATYPGGYFGLMNGFDFDGDSVYVFGTYTNSTGGASPVMLYYSKDFGVTWRVFYTYGQSPLHTDTGTDAGGEGGNLLGSATNPLLTRHIHDVSYSNGYFYAGSGDALGEMHILKCLYNYETDTWTVNDLLNTTTINRQRFRGMGFFDTGTKYIWGTDGSGSFTVNGVSYKNSGVFSCHYDSLNDITAHVTLIQPDTAFYSFKKYGNTYFGIPFQSNQAVISEDNGLTWNRALLNNIKYYTGNVSNGAWQSPSYDPIKKRILMREGSRRILFYLK